MGKFLHEYLGASKPKCLGEASLQRRINIIIILYDQRTYENYCNSKFEKKKSINNFADTHSNFIYEYIMQF